MDFGGEYNKARFQDFLNKNGGMRLKIEPLTPESNQLRGYFEGCLVALATYYDEHLDWKNPDDRSRMREVLKMEFNPDFVNFGGHVKKIAKSTKGREPLMKMVEDVSEWLKENYNPPIEATSPEVYKKWKDTIYPFGGAATYLEYLEEIKVLKKHE